MFRSKENLLLERIVELSSRPWIQQKYGEPQVGDWIYHKEKREMEMVDTTDIMRGSSFSASDGCVWVPLSWRPDTCRWQVDDFIMELGKFKNDEQAQAGFDAWRVREVVHKGQPCMLEENGSPAELRLMYLNWLIDQEEGKK